MRFALLLLIAGALAAVDVAAFPSISDNALASMTDRGNAILEQMLADARGPYRPPVSTAKRREWQARVDAVEARRGTIVPAVAFEIGSAGCLSTAFGQGFQVVQVIGPSDLLADVGGGLTVWFELPTEGMFDDAIVAVPWLIEVVGTKSYGSVSGAQRTVLHARAVSIPATNSDGH